MKNDIEPSVICALFCTDKAFQNMKEDFKKNKVGWRELKLIDVSFPLDDEHYNKQANYFKTFLRSIMRNFIYQIPFLDTILKRVNLKKFDYETFEARKEQREFKNRLSYLGFTPLFIDDKHKADYTEKELKNLKKLYSFETNNYNPKSLSEQGILQNKDMDCSFMEGKKIKQNRDTKYLKINEKLRRKTIEEMEKDHDFDNRWKK